MSLAEKSFSTTLWALVEKVGTLGVSFCVSMLLARLLTPSDYGVVAMLTVFIAISNQFVECGFANALIRKKECTPIDLSTAFYFNVAVGVTVYLILFWVAPLVGDFYQIPFLVEVLRVNGLLLIVNSLLIVPTAMLTRTLAFKKMAKFNILAGLISGGIALILAYYDFGVWALVFQSLSSSILTVIFLYAVLRWKPVISFSISSLNYLWGFGSKMLLTGIIGSIYSNVYSLVIGKIYDSKMLGFFNRGQNIALLMPNIINSTFAKSTLPLLAQVQDDKDRLVGVYRKFAILVAFVSFPLIALIFILAKPFVLFLLTNKWAGAIIYIQIFAVSALTGPIGLVNLNLMQATGRSDLTLKAELIKKIVGFLLVGILCQFSPLILALGSMILNIFIYMVNLYYARKIIGISFFVQLRDILPYLFASVMMAGVVWIVVSLVNLYLCQLIIGSFVGLFVYFLITKYIIKTDMYSRVAEMYRKRA